MHERGAAALVLVSLLAAGSCLQDATSVPPPPAPDSLALHLVAQGLQRPVFLTAVPNDTDRLFVVEQGGRVRIIRHDTLLARVFLDLSAAVTAGGPGEQGFLSIAFHPDYTINGYLFASFTNRIGDARVVRYRVSSDPDSVDAFSGDTILSQRDTLFNHNGGLLAFGSDRYLYFGLGDGGGGNDFHGHGQDLGVLFGKMLRLNVDDALPYAIPATNPFVGTAGARPEIWARGLRNPWRFSFDRETGDLYIGDVGQNAREEVSFQAGTSAGGENYGWNIMEGGSCRGGGTCTRTGLVLPVVDYPNPAEGCAVTGGYVYRGARIASYRGTYFYADYCRGWIRSFRIVSGAATDHRDWSQVLATGGNVSSFGEDARGELYVVVHGGRIYRIVAR